jgi:hypothetical protein
MPPIAKPLTGEGGLAVARRRYEQHHAALGFREQARQSGSLNNAATCSRRIDRRCLAHRFPLGTRLCPRPTITASRRNFEVSI